MIPVLDVTPISAVVICPVRRCGWRAIELNPDLALLRFHEHSARCHERAQSVPLGTCTACGTIGPVMPRKRVCAPCHRAERAGKAKRVYAQRGRADRRTA